MPSFSRRTKIVCTLGPATQTAAMMERLMRAGMNIARLNLSHGTYESHEKAAAMVRRLSARLGTRVALFMDLPGPKYRTGRLRGGQIELKKGTTVTLTTRDIEGSEDIIPVNLPNFDRDAKAGDTVLIDDGAIEIRVTSVKGTDIRARVVNGGRLTERRGLVIPGKPNSEPFMTDDLRKHLEFSLRIRPDFLALSFVRGADDIGEVRGLMGGIDIPIISKIERVQAVTNFASILETTDAVMVARGDLGVDIPVEKVPLVQKEIIARCNRAGKPVITATQMLESMVNAPRPTRAEVTDVANAIFDGTDAVMLSAETSIGKYPVQAASMMARIARVTEKDLPYERMLSERGSWLERQTDELISYNACYTASALGAKAVIAYTQSGSTARRVSKYRARVPVIAVTPGGQIANRLVIHWGVYPVIMENPSSVDLLFSKAAGLAEELKLARKGDLVIITGGVPVGTKGATNLLKVQRI